MAKKKTTRVPRPDGEIKNRFDEQLKYLSYAASGYDNGDHSLIKMATPALRSLFLEQKFGKTLIEQLKIGLKAPFQSSVAFGPKTVLFSGPVFVGWQISQSQPKLTAEYLPACYQPTAPRSHSISLENWWSGRLVILNDKSITREMLVRYVANQDGGAHVDPELNEEYDNLLRGLYSWTYSQFSIEIQVEDLHLALVRQVVHETIRSFQALKLASASLNYSDGSNVYTKYYKPSDPLIMGATLQEGNKAFSNVYY